MKQTNKSLEIGQVVNHNPSGSRWIIVDTNPYTGKRTRENYKKLITAYCLYSGNKPHYWLPGKLDEWVLNDKDLAKHDKIWTIV